MMTRFTNPNTGEYYKEYDPRIASYIDDELLGGRFSAKQTDYNYRFLPEGMKDEPENYQYFEEGDPMMPAGAEKNYLGTAWSAGTVSNLATAYDPSFQGSMRHSDYINRAFQGEATIALHVRLVRLTTKSGIFYSKGGVILKAKDIVHSVRWLMLIKATKVIAISLPLLM